MGDSLLKFAGKACTRKDCDVRCYTAIRLEELQHQMEEIYLINKMSRCNCDTCRYQHARRGMSTTEIMGDTMDPVDCIRKQVPKTKVIISRVLYWQNNS